MYESESPVPDAVPEGMGRVTVLIPTYNGAARISNCLKALLPQTTGRDIEILVIDDGSTDATVETARSYQGVRVLSQANAGPAAARNRGANEATGEILLFTDDDCVPLPNWIEAMLAPFADPEVVGVKGIYRTCQSELTARFVQLEYEDKYRIMAAQPRIDFIDTYSAGFRRGRFLEMGGYDTSFPVACAEDVELSYRMSARNWLMKFTPDAVVYHSHPNTPGKYFRKKYKFAYWRVLAVRKNPSKSIKDSHTPQTMKLQLLLLPALLVAGGAGFVADHMLLLLAVILAAFFLTTAPFTARALQKDRVAAVLSPALLAGRAIAQFLGVMGGLMRALRKERVLLRVGPLDKR